MRLFTMLLRSSLLLALIGFVLLSPTHAQCDASPAERELLRLANAERALRDIPPLTWSPALAQAARSHAARIAHEPGELSHQYAGEPAMVDRAAHAGARFMTLSENLARGAATPAQLQQLWMSTPVHRANLLNPQLDAVGVGVIASDGVLFAVEDFALSVPALDEQEIEQRLTAALRARGLIVVAPPESAASLCREGKGLTANTLLVVQWDGPDPTTLPEALVRQLAANTYRAATLGVCAAQLPNHALSYRVTVQLH